MVVLVVGPNPAVQRVLRFDALELGGVNRASGLDQYVGGKGQGAALALQLWVPEEGPHAVAQFLGGESGRYVESALAAAGLATITQQVAGPTRTCTTLLHDGGTNTELIDPCDAANPNPNPNPNLNPDLNAGAQPTMASASSIFAIMGIVVAVFTSRNYGLAPRLPTPSPGLLAAPESWELTDWGWPLI